MQDIPSEQSIQKRQGTINFGDEYEYLIPALYTLRCIFRKDIKNLWLACNVGDLGAFDDVYLRLEYTSGRRHLYVMQLKHMTKGIEERLFTLSKRRKDHFCLQKYHKSFQKIEENCDQAGHILQDVNLKDVSFILYTTADLKPSGDKMTVEKLKLTWENFQGFEEKLLQTSGGSVYKLHASKGSKLFSPNFLAQFYLFTKQSNTDQVQRLIYEIIDAEFGNVSTTLTKAHMWNKLIEGFDVVLLKPSPSAVGKIWSSINAVMEEQTGVVIPASSSWLKPFGRKLKKGKASGLKQVLMLRELYVALWKAQTVPLFVKADTNVRKSNVAVAMRLVKSTKNEQQFIVIEEEFEEERLKDLKVFRGIETLTEDKIETLQDVQVCLQGRHLTMKFDQVLRWDPRLKHCVSTDLLLEILQETFVIGDKLQPLPAYYIERRVGKPAVHVRALEELVGSVFVVCGSQEVLKKFKMVNSMHYSDLKSGTSSNIITTSSEDDEIFERICIFVRKRDQKHVHKLRLVAENDEYLEWLQSSENLEELRPYLSYNSLVFHETELKHETNIICGDPGMGKSTMANYLALNYAPDYWVVKINLADHAKNLTEIETYSDLSNYFFNMTCTTNNHFAKIVYETLVDQAKLCLICDGFDVASYLYVHKVSQLLKDLRQKGHHLWVLGRPAVQQHLEDLFQRPALKLQPLNADDQSKFFAHSNAPTFVQGYSRASCFSEDCLEVPLRIKMFADILQEKETSLVDLYEKLIGHKLDLYWEKLGVDKENAQLQAWIKRQNRKLKSQHSKAALSLFYSKELLEEVFHFEDLEDFLLEIKNGACNVGVIVGVKDKPIFEHHSYAEYLAAKWLTENCHRKHLVGQMFKRKLKGLRYFFDRILASESGLHSALLDRNQKNVDELLPTQGTSVDKGGKTILHVAAGCSLEHIFPTERLNEINTQDHYIDPLTLSTRETLTKALEAGVDPNQEDFLGWTALDYADKSNCLGAVQVLIAKTKTLSLNMFSHKNSLVYFCAKHDYVNIFKAIEGEHPVVFTEMGESLLHVAAQNGSVAMLEHMLGKHAEVYRKLVRLQDKRNQTPLYYADRGRVASDGIQEAKYKRSVEIVSRAMDEVHDYE